MTAAVITNAKGMFRFIDTQSLDLECIKIDKDDFAKACVLSEFVELMCICGGLAVIRTNRLSRRELTRNGIPFEYRSN